MKILKNKTYNNLIRFKEQFELMEFELRKEHQTKNELYKQISYLTKEKSEIVQNFEKKLSDNALNFNINRLILGKKGVGKTSFIKNKILPKLKNYLVIDFNNEYSDLPENKRYTPSVPLSEITDNVMRVIKNNEDKVVIIDDIFLVPNLFEKLMRECNHINYIISAQSKLRVDNYVDRFDFIFDLGTLDSFSKKTNVKYIKPINIGNIFFKSLFPILIGFGLACIINKDN